MECSRRVLHTILLSFLLPMTTACEDPSPIPAEAGVPATLAHYRSSVLSDVHYDLKLALPGAPEKDIPGTITITFELADASRPLQLDFREDGKRLLAATVNGRDIAIAFEQEHVVIPAGRLKAGSNSVSFDFLAGPSSLNRNPDFLYTLFVPDRARTAFPLFDQPDLKASWKLELTMPADWQTISSAPVAEDEVIGERRRVDFARSDRISTYLFSFVAGDFDTETREIGGHRMTMLHRETDAARVARNVDEIFRLHGAALEWLAGYTGIELPFQKLDFALLPAHPYGGMEHVGAIQYRAESLLLDEGASDSERLGRASLIAHEVAHMWFGNLVTMRWFDDVWTKEVFANFMAAKIVNPSFPGIDHDLNFLVDHHPGAYAIDRTPGANAIRQELANLNEAGQLYGPIIYDKAPIMMRQLELLLGEENFRSGLKRYLTRFSHGNASWPELIEILDGYTQLDLKAWSDSWVNSPGRPVFELTADETGTQLVQRDPAGTGRLWPQSFAISPLPPESAKAPRFRSDAPADPLPGELPNDPARLLLNADGYGYGLFPADPRSLQYWQKLDELPLAALLVNLQEQMLDRGEPRPDGYFASLLSIAEGTRNQLLLDLALKQLRRIFWTLMDARARHARAPELERRLEDAMLASETDSLRKIYFSALTDVAVTASALDRLDAIWAGELLIDDLPLSERDFVRLTRLLAIKRPGKANDYLRTQLARTQNPDQRRRLAWQAPSLSADRSERDAFFHSLADENERATETWVLDALANLHHPLRVPESEAYLRPSLELLEEIQATGDIFFPAGWLRASFANHYSNRAIAIVTEFLDTRPDYNPQLRMKIQQATDPVFRANRLRATQGRDTTLSGM